MNIAGAVRGAFVRVLRGFLDFTVRVYEKAGEDDIFFLAGGIAFNILVVAVPFLLLIISVVGFVLENVVDDPVAVAVEYVTSILPPSRQVREYTSTFVRSIIAERTQFGALGLVLFVWITTRLIGTLRTTLRFVFDLQEDRGIISGKIFDLQMVVVAGTLFLANTGITVALETVRGLGTDWLEERGLPLVRVADAAWAQLLAFVFIFTMFALIYRYLPYRRTPWRISLVAAAFAALAWELLKGVFTWYVSYVANFGTAYGRVATLVVVVFWIYYSAVVFILGGEVGQVYDLNRIRRKQRELLE